MNQLTEQINLINPETGDRVRTTRKVLDTYYGQQGYVEELPDDDDAPPFLEVSLPKFQSHRQPALRGAAKIAADKKAAK